MQKVVLFDFDGTVVNSMGELAVWASELINKYYELAIPIAKELYLRTSGLSFHEQMEIMFPNGNKNKVIVNAFESKKEREFMNHKVFPDAPEVFKYLKNKGYIVGISSSNMPHIIKKFLKGQGVDADEYLGFESLEFTKGKPHFEYIKKKYGVNYEDIIFVGDSIKDKEKASECGVKFIAKTGINSKKDFKAACSDILIIDKLTELKNIL
ncbi:MAG: HAD family hydrolase [Tepidanaerobacter acetatoxydans]|uniref:HAD family hydrolase n=1 Tax=Tepidanaerobacter acetatoxydans TaxID=499229 RepID=UPI0026EAE05B|nr:HAD-IA family hydrolase [Tepidanaerobacter acetatoxydans]NLU10650.1 HAD family hydrolase [Tepidanaerobacter acetatoxydans]